MGQSKFSDLLKTENSSSVQVKESYGYQNVVDIENITRTWFQLMVNLNESPKVRSFFANEVYSSEHQEWSITPTDYTRSFLTSGIVIYEAKSVETGAVEAIVITEDSSESEIDRIHDLSSSSEYEVVAVMRWAGCGMKIPKTAKLALNPNIVWPVLTFDTDVDGQTATIKIQNSSNQITWSEAIGEEQKNGKMLVTDKNYQGQACGDFHIPGEVVQSSVHLELPYTCASFDILTKIHLGAEEDEMVIFTS